MIGAYLRWAEWFRGLFSAVEERDRERERQGDGDHDRRGRVEWVT